MGAGAGRPKGSVKPKIMADALIFALNRLAADGKTKKLTQVAKKLVELAIDGDVTAIKEIFDRVEGKAAQTTILQGDEDGGAVRFEKIIREVIDPK